MHVTVVSTQMSQIIELEEIYNTHRKACQQLTEYINRTTCNVNMKGN